MTYYEKWKEYYRYSIFCQWIEKIFAFCGVQWSRSRAVSSFVALPHWEQQLSQGSVFYKIWQALRKGVTSLYNRLHLEKICKGSIFLTSGLWCSMTVLFAAVLPTMVVLAMVLAATVTVFLDFVRQPEKQLQNTSFTPCIVLTTAFYLGITFTSVSVSSSLPVGLIMSAFMFTPVVLVQWANSLLRVRTLTKLFVLSGALVGFYGIYQFIFGASAGSGWVDTDMFGSIEVRVYSTLQNPNMLAQFLVLVLPFAVALLLTAKDWNGRFLWLVCCGLITVALICTYSRGGWLGALIAAVIFLLLFQPKLLILAPVALVALYFVLPDSVISRFTSIGNLEDSSTSYRVSIWMGSIALLKDYWICGVGPGVGVFNLIYPYYSYSTASAQHAHNLFLQLMVDGGLALLFLFLLVVLVFCRETFRFIGKNNKDPNRLFVIASVAGVGGFLAQGMTDYSFYNYRVALAYWISLGLGIAWTTVGTSSNQSIPTYEELP